jgi:hypothetical protein
VGGGWQRGGGGEGVVWPLGGFWLLVSVVAFVQVCQIQNIVDWDMIIGYDIARDIRYFLHSIPDGNILIFHLLNPALQLLIIPQQPVKIPLQLNGGVQNSQIVLKRPLKLRQNMYWKLIKFLHEKLIVLSMICCLRLIY